MIYSLYLIILSFFAIQFRNSSFMDSLDVSFSCPLLGFKNLEDFYNWTSSYSYMDQIVDLPVLLVNTKNDHLVDWLIVEAIIEDYCKRTNENAIGVMPEYGGHLGFFQGSFFAPQRISWLDEVSIQHAKSIVLSLNNQSSPME